MRAPETGSKNRSPTPEKREYYEKGAPIVGAPFPRLKTSSLPVIFGLLARSGHDLVHCLGVVYLFTITRSILSVFLLSARILDSRLTYVLDASGRRRRSHWPCGLQDFKRRDAGVRTLAKRVRLNRHLRADLDDPIRRQCEEIGGRSSALRAREMNNASCHRARPDLGSDLIQRRARKNDVFMISIDQPLRRQRSRLFGTFGSSMKP